MNTCCFSENQFLAKCFRKIFSLNTIKSFQEKQIDLLRRAAVDDEYDELYALPLSAPLLTILTIWPWLRAIIPPSKSLVI